MKGLKIVTIGGGSSYTPELIEGLIKRYDELPVSELWLVDIEEGKRKLEIVGQLARRMVLRAGLPMKIYLTLDRQEALKDADFVTTQFRVGQLDAREKDELIPLKYDVIGQETNGPGGCLKHCVLFRSSLISLRIAKNFVLMPGSSRLRTLPALMLRLFSVTQTGNVLLAYAMDRSIWSRILNMS